MRFDRALVGVEFHTGGQGMRLLTTGLGRLPGATMREKRASFEREHGWLRTALCMEPRGHRDMLMAVLTEPVSEDADLGLLFMDGKSYLDSCGEATIGSVTIAVETGLVSASGSETAVKIDTVGGVVETIAHSADSRVSKVTLQMSASYVGATRQIVKVDGLGEVDMDIAIGAGNVFGIVDADSIGVTIDRDHAKDVLVKGVAIREAANEQLTLGVPGLEGREVEMIEVAGALDADGTARNAVIWGPGAIDRAPCGTGTCARLALLQHRGEMPSAGRLIHEGILGTRFEGQIVGETEVEAGPAVLPAVSGTAYITGFSQYVFSPDDPVREGYLLAL